MLHLLLPRAMLHRAPELGAVMQANTARLSTPYDVHATLLHLLRMHNSLAPPQAPQGMLACT